MVIYMDNRVDNRRSTPLRLPAPLTEEEQEEFLADHGITEFYFADKLTVAESMEKYLGAEEIALVREIVLEGKVPVLFIHKVLYALASFMTRAHCFNSLLTMRRLLDTIDYDSISFVTFHCIVRKLTNNEQPGDKHITTEERLASYTAAVTFALDCINENLNLIKEQRDNGSVTFQYAITNDHLLALILERPEQEKDIVEYIKERGMHRINKRPVEALRQYLDTHKATSAVSEGWL